MHRFLYITACFCFWAIVSSAQSVSDLDNRRKKTEEEIAYIDSLLNKNKAQQKSSVEGLQLVQRKIKSRQQLIADIDAQVYLLEKQIDGRKERISGLELNLSELQKSYEQLLYQAYKNRDKRLWLMYILASNDLGLAYRRWQYFRSYSNYINEQALKIKQARTDLQSEINSLNTTREEHGQRLQERQQEMQNMRREESDSQRLIRNLSAEQKKLQQQVDEKRKAIERLNREIEKIIAEEAKKAGKEAATPAADRALSANFESNRGRLPWPVSKGVVVEKFGEQVHPVFKNIKMPPNNGINISTEQGSDVMCVFEGVVTSVFTIPGMQHCVMVKHGEFFTLYCKLQSTTVKTGDKVPTRGVVGKVFTSDETTLHFEIWKDRSKLNPELWLSQ